MKQIRTSSGFEAQINENAADDLAFLDLICDLDDGNVRAYRAMLDKLLTEEDKQRLFNHVRTEDGRIPVSAINTELAELIKGIGKK